MSRSAEAPGTLPVTALIPAYNRPEMTARAVRSALGQVPRPPAEVLVVDDCSTDGTGEAAAEAGARVVRHERNQGEGAARNTGLAEATQPWIALLDSDDVWRPGFLATLWPLTDGHVLVAGSALRRGPAAGQARYAGPIRPRARTLSSPAVLLYPENFVTNSGVMVRADVVRDAGGYVPGLRFGADLDLWLRVLERGPGVMSPAVVVDYELHAGQVTQDRDGMAAAQLEVMRAYAGRPWYSAARVEAWRGGAAWDRLRRCLDAGDRPGALAAARFLAGHPARPAGLAGILGRRFCMRRLTGRRRDTS
jgi:glycosyltransferase involved in cell wall biosynthesis